MQEIISKEKVARVISLLGAFNYDVGLAMDELRLSNIYRELIKRFALVTETAREGAGDLFLSYVKSSTPEDVSTKEFQYEFESLVVYGKSFNELSENEQMHVRDLQILGESSHFSRIMDVDDISDKKMVGVADAGNQRMVRMLMNVVRYREDLELKTYWPMADRILIDTTPDCSVAKSPVLERSTYPYLSLVVNSNDEEVAKSLTEIFHRLICSYPLEVSFVLLEEWLMNNRIGNKDISINVVQVLNQNELFKIKIGSMGGGVFIVKNNEDHRVVKFNMGDESNYLGNIDGQIKHSIMELEVKPYTQVLILPKHLNINEVLDIDALFSKQKTQTQKILKAIFGSDQFNFSSLLVNPKKIKPFYEFNWSSEHVSEKLQKFLETIKNIKPDVVNIQYGHIHSDRDPSKDQEVGGFITRVLAENLKKTGVKVVSMPMIDNYHVEDRIDIKKWLDFLEENSKIATDEPNFESALITRHLADEALHELQKEKSLSVKNIGGNVYYDAGKHCRIELYDGVGDYNLPGRMGCVPFEVGLEIYRLNPTLANKYYRQFIMDNFPNSLISKWWQNDPGLSYQQLIHKNVYSLNPEDRRKIKKQKDMEIDVPYKEKVLEKRTNYLNDIFEKTDLSKIVLVHVMESFYNAQHAKFSTLWNACNLPKINLWRIGFNRYNGDIEILDTNIDKDTYQKIIGHQNR